MEMNEYKAYLVNWLKELLDKTGCKGYVVGLSGGIDSSLVAHLVTEATDNCMGVIMPCDSIANDKLDALKVVETSKIDYREIDLTDTFNALKLNFKDPKNNLTLANIKARLRMTTLYAVASEHNYLVVGTDNMAEWHTGYFTKFGDGGVDLVPIVHLTKGQVREMATLCGVDSSIVNKAPSAGLFAGQTDETEMGTTYDKIDSYLLGGEIPKEDQDIIDRLHRVSAHKRVGAVAPDVAYNKNPRKF